MGEDTYLCVPKTKGHCATGAVLNLLREEGGIGVFLQHRTSLLASNFNMRALT
jgi:hypothetical protein